ncbi:MAG: GH36-type glycosyl hydrolase domain-containing protein, partial [Aquabacterium sp.]
CDRSECFDTAGRAVLATTLGRRSGLGLDPCAVLACELNLAGNAADDAVLLLGHADSADAALRLATRAIAVDPQARLHKQRQQWSELSGAVQVRTPDPAFDVLVNHWLPYQTVACRLWARAGFYQAGGAYGFRDQLQDAMSLVNHAPQMLADQIRRHAARQFERGDVQHWWHEPGGAGVRTRFSDDLLWLPAALVLYIERSGQLGLLDELLPFIEGGDVPPEHEDLYEVPRPAAAAPATLYEHAARAIDHSLPTGAHGLPLIGTGDWNDGMNRVGHEGRGESVWLAWFLCDVVARMLPLAQARGDTLRAAAWSAARAGWVAALEAAGWDGRWYRRAYFDDGTPLGSDSNTEGRIDLIAQAWAVLSGAAADDRAPLAMRSAHDLLFDEPHELLRLLTPPLQAQRPSAGYIQAYPPGVRENGGQYNHAAVWALMAFARLGQAGPAWRAFKAVSPAHRWQDAARGSTYGLEPYVLAGDIYSAAPRAGRGGWSWYSGSAGWLLRAAIESLCGVTLAQGVVQLQPCLPSEWNEAEVSLRFEGHHHRLLLCRGETAFRAALQRWPQAQVRQLGTPIPLAGRSGDSITVIDLSAGSADGPAWQHQFVQRPLALLRAADD